MKIMNMKMRRQLGFTILELIIALVVAAILISVAVPSLQDIFKRNEVAGQNNELVALIHLARNEAIRRNPVGNETVAVEFVRNLGESTWSGFVRPSGTPEDVPGCPTGAIRCSSHSKVALDSPAWAGTNFVVNFDNRGYSVDGDGAPQEVVLFLIHADCETGRHARRIRVLPAGQVSSDADSCEPAELDS